MLWVWTPAGPRAGGHPLGEARRGPPSPQQEPPAHTCPRPGRSPGGPWCASGGGRLGPRILAIGLGVTERTAVTTWSPPEGSAPSRRHTGLTVPRGNREGTHIPSLTVALSWVGSARGQRWKRSQRPLGLLQGSLDPAAGLPAPARAPPLCPHSRAPPSPGPALPAQLPVGSPRFPLAMEQVPRLRPKTNLNKPGSRKAANVQPLSLREKPSRQEGTCFGP